MMVYKGRHLVRRQPFVSVLQTMALKWIFVALVVCYLQSTALAGDATSNSNLNTGMIFKELAIQKSTGQCLAYVAKAFGQEVGTYVAAIVLSPFKAVAEFYPKELVSRAKEMWTDLTVKCDSSLSSMQCTKQKIVKAAKQLIGMGKEILQSLTYIFVRAVELEILSIGATLQALYFYVSEFASCFRRS